MKTIPSVQTEHQLTAVADRFDAWRQTRITRTEPIPQHLWEQAIALTTMFAISRVATRLRVSGGELKASRLRRDNLSSIAYSEKLNSSTISATLQSTDRHHGIVGQKRSHFQRDS